VFRLICGKRDWRFINLLPIRVNYETYSTALQGGPVRKLTRRICPAIEFRITGTNQLRRTKLGLRT
jgi:hypothetical protein